MTFTIVSFSSVQLSALIRMRATRVLSAMCLASSQKRRVINNRINKLVREWLKCHL